MSKLKGKSRAKARKKVQLEIRKKQDSYRQNFLNRIRKWDDPILKEICSDVEQSDNISSIISDMRKILYFSKNGVGLSASQIGVAKRIALVLLDKKYPTILINPSIVSHSEEQIKSREGCLSYPGIEAIVDRYKQIKVKYQDENWNTIERDFDGFNGVVISHEIDHTMGVCQVGDYYYNSKVNSDVEAE